MVLTFIVVFLLFINALYPKECDTAFNISKITVYSYQEIRNDDIISRKVYFGFRVYQGDSLVLSVGEFYDKPAEITLNPGKYLFSFNTPKGWKSYEIHINKENLVIYFEKLSQNQIENN